MKTKKIYVASSWRNEHQQTLVNELRLMGHEVYDFKHPNGEAGFKWSNMDENWQGWTMEQYRENLESEYAQFGMNRDFDAMKEADVCILCLPCGRSAHLEAGWMKGAGKKVIAYIHPGERIEPELMYGILDGIALSIQDVSAHLNKITFEHGAICLRVEEYNQFPYKDLEEGFATGLWYVKEDECTANGYEDGVFYDNNKNNQKEDKQ